MRFDFNYTLKFLWETPVWQGVGCTRFTVNRAISIQAAVTKKRRFHFFARLGRVCALTIFRLLPMNCLEPLT